jgi:predicted MFS family arabinose efflux permease
MALYQSVFLFAVGIGPLPGGLLAEHVGLWAPFLVFSLAGAGAAALAWLRVAETRDAHTGGRSALAEPPPAFATQLRLLVRQIGFVLVGLTSFMNAVARTGALFSVIPVLAQEQLGLSVDRIGLAMALASVVGLATAYPAGVLADRYGRKPVIVPATLLSGLSLILFVLAPSYGWFLVACVAWSVAADVGGAAPAAYAADVAPPGMNAAAMSAYRMLADLGYVLGPLAVGLAADMAGPETALNVTAALLVAVAVLFAILAPETHRPPRR